MATSKSIDRVSWIGQPLGYTAWEVQILQDFYCIDQYIPINSSIKCILEPAILILRF